jgi:hypothetical protein
MPLKLDPKNDPKPFAQASKDPAQAFRKKRPDEGDSAAQLSAKAQQEGGSAPGDAAAVAGVLSHYSDAPSPTRTPIVERPNEPRLERPYALPKPNKNKKRLPSEEADEMPNKEDENESSDSKEQGFS